MNKVRLLPVVILAVAAVLVLKTMGLVTNGGYVLAGVTQVQAAGDGGGHAAPASGETLTLPSEPTLSDAAPTLRDTAPTMGENPSASDHGAPADGELEQIEAEPAQPPTNAIVAANACDPRPVNPDEVPSGEGQLMVIGADCAPLTDAVPQLQSSAGTSPLNANGTTLTEQTLLERLAERRTDLDAYEQELEMRASLVQAAEQRIDERQQTLQSIENQIASLVEQRKEMEAGQFAGIVAMYETMKPKDAAKIFNALDMDVLLRVAKMMSPRKMSPILAEMDTVRAQELTVRLASAGTDPLDSMTPDDLASLPQIVGQ